MQRDDRIRIQHMLEAAKEAILFSENRTRDDLDSDRSLGLSLLKLIEIVGEAATQVSDQSRETFSMIPWRNIIGMRNRLIHAYFDVNLSIVWDTVTTDLPPLVAALEEILSAEDGE